MTRAARDVLVLALIVLLTLSASAAWAQLSTAELNGQVTDSSGAVLPGVTVTVTQADTGLTRTVVTDGSGLYLLSNLPTGPYRLEVSLQGFRSYVQTGLVLTVGAAPTINVSLTVGSLEETVTVEAAAPLVDVRSAGISDVVENERILELPLQARQVTDLLVLSGAAVQTGEVSDRGIVGSVYVSVAGGLPAGVGYTLDGASHNSRQMNANLPLPFPDALQEFRVATSGLAAEYGVHSGAAVNAVTKSGTNRFSGNGFEFMRHHSLNSTDVFAGVGPDGRRTDDGLKRNQFGGTFGGPIARDRLFFFAGYQGTATRVRPTSNIAYVPTAAMLAGDFTAFASPACNGGRQLTLRAPYVNNRINPALFSPAALNLARRIPTSTDPCGEMTFDVQRNRDEYLPVARIDFQPSSRHSFFGRYMLTWLTDPPGYAGGSDNLLKTNLAPGRENRVHSLAFGETTVFSSAVVNALRVGINKTKVEIAQKEFFDPQDLGVKLFSYLPGYMPMTVSGAFEFYTGTATKALYMNHSYQVANDLTVVRGNHQFSVGADLEFWEGDYNSASRASGNWIFDGSATGSSIADLLVGRVTSVEHGGLGKLPVDSWYAGFYAQDAWRVSNRVTVNAGLRWEPLFGQNVQNGVISVFDMENFLNGVRSTVYHKAPAGFLWDGDPGFPENGKTGMDKQWWNFSPRLGLAWDVHGDGHLAVRSSYAMMYDFMSGDFHNIHANAPPFGNRLRIVDPVGLFDDPYAGFPGGDPHPIVTGPNTDFPPFGTFGTMDPDINSPRIQSWNATVEQQLGSDWGVSASYIGSYSDRLWAQQQLNPGIFMGLGPCTIRGVAYRICTANSNLNERRALYQLNPADAQFIGSLDEVVDIGFQKYHGLKLSARRRTPSGLSLNGSYTLSRCTGTDTPNGFDQASAGYLNPDDPSFDDGYCDQDRKHLATLTLGYVTPMVDNSALRAVVSNWRLSGIVSARTGSRIDLQSGRDDSFNGQRFQRPDEVGSDYYGGKTLTNYFDRAAFGQPTPGTLGNLKRNAAVGPNYWNVDLAISRLISLSATQRAELRLESFNLLNHFNWGNPVSNFNSGTFGRITSMAGAPRIIQLGIKYDF